MSFPHHFMVHVLRTNLCINTCVYAATYHSLGLPGFQLFVSSADIKSSAKGTSCGDKWSYIVSVWDRQLLVVSEINKPMFDYK